MTVLFIDCETFSEVDVTAVGAPEYARHPSTEVVLWSVLEPSWPRSLVFERGSLYELLHELKNASQLKWTRHEPLMLVHWGEFDRLIARYASDPVFDWPEAPIATTGPPAIPGPENTWWCDLREVSLTYDGPGKLVHAAKWWAGTEAKDPGKTLIKRFCAPQKNGQRIRPGDDPVRWERFRSYAGQDTNVLRPIYERLNAIQGGHSHRDHWYWIGVIRRMNERGVPIDRESCRRAWSHFEQIEHELVAECEDRFGFSPSQTEEVRKFLGTPNVQKETLETFSGTPDQNRVAEIRLTTAGAARRKIAPMLRLSNRDGRVRSCFDYHGAWTRRLTSFGVQFQNFVREPSDERFFEGLFGIQDESIFAEARKNIRGFIRAPEGRAFVAGDYSQIELRVSAWLAGERWLLRELEQGSDPYRTTAAAIYGKPRNAISKDSPERQFGKIVELAAGYGLGAVGLQNQCLQQTPKIELTDGEADQTIKVYRRTHPAIVHTWRIYQDWFEQLIRMDPGACFEGPVRFERHATHIRIVRPSGFAQYFWTPRLAPGTWPDGAPKEDIAYVGRIKSGAMGWKRTYGGDIFQGVVQGIAADLMLHGMGVVERAGYRPVLSIHDEVVCEIEDDGRDHVERLCRLLCQLPRWADGLPVKAEGWQGRRFTK